MTNLTRRSFTRLAEGRIKATSAFVSQKGETADLRKQNYKESVDWYASIIADVFG